MFTSRKQDVLSDKIPNTVRNLKRKTEHCKYFKIQL